MAARLRSTTRWVAMPAVAAAITAAVGDVRAEPAADADAIEHTVIVGVGGALEVEPGDGTAHAGTNVMVEWDAIEDWLELELGASVLSASRGIEVPVDLLFKKPFRLARWAEVMVGVGPEVVRVTGSDRGTYFGAEAALDFMFWPSRGFGLWVEPSYDFVLHSGVSHGLGGTGGLLIGW
jgi:hypothetical protein